MLRPRIPFQESRINDAYGVCYDLDTGTFTRSGTLSEYSATYSAKPFSNVPDLLLPIQRNMRRCLLNDDLSVNYYLDASDSTKKTNGEAAVLDGTDGQVMVEIPAHWWKFEKTGNVLYWWIAPTKKTSPGWQYFKKSYIGAYEAQMYDDSASAIVGGQGGADIANDRLCSVSGVQAHTSERRSTYRAIAANRGSGWFQQANHIYAAIARLYLVEYANFNTQDKISAGLTNASNSDWSAYNGYKPLVNAGLTNSLGNSSGEVAVVIANFVGGTEDLNTQVMSYRGIENWYGHIWKWLDGANVHNSPANKSRLYLCEDPANFADDTDTNYEIFGLLPEADGYGGEPLGIAGGIYPANVTGSSTTGLCDYYYTTFDSNPDDGWHVVDLGGNADSGVTAGAFCVPSGNVSSSGNSRIGGRLCAAVSE